MKKMYTYPDAEVVMFASADNTNLVSHATVGVGEGAVGSTDKLNRISLSELHK